MELAFEQKQRSCLKRTAHLSLAQEQTQELIIPDSMPDASRTLICCAEPEVQSKTNREGSLLVTGTLRTGCLYADEAGGLQLLTSELPFTVKLECAELREDTQTLVRCCVRSADSRLINSRKVLLRVSVLVQADGYEPQTQSMSGGEVKSQTVGAWSKTYASGTETAEAARKTLENIAMDYLAWTGLLYRGGQRCVPTCCDCL